jgi:hypothetical protein
MFYTTEDFCLQRRDAMMSSRASQKMEVKCGDNLPDYSEQFWNW